MTTIRAARPVPLRLTTDATSPRMTPPSVSERFVSALRQGGSVFLRGVEGAATFLPGGELLSAAVRGAAGASGGSAASPGSSATPEGPGASPEQAAGSEGTGSIEDSLARAQQFNLYYLDLQERMAAEQRRYTALSNVLRAQHETAKNAIGNIR